MTSSLDAVQILRTPEVKSYLINVFGIAGSAEASYERVLEFFTLHSQLMEQVALQSGSGDESELDRKAVVSAAAKELGIWDPERILRDTDLSIRRGLRRFGYAQHKNGGWGYYPEDSSAWATAHALLALEAARKLEITPPADQVNGGFSWLETHFEKWSLAHIPPKEINSVYEASLVIRCFVRNNRKFEAVDLCLQEIVNRQNADGGWDAAYPGTQRVVEPELNESEIGATSMALQALAAVGTGQYDKLIERGLQWILSTQQPDGFWVSGPRDLPPERPNQPSLSKTCDALSGIAAARHAGIKTNCAPSISRALDWIIQKEKFLSPSSGWGYDQVQERDKRSDLVSTCLVLEALVQTEDVALPLIATWAQLLMAAQTREPGVEEGAWKRGDTFRITLALIQYWIKVKASQESPAPAAQAGVNEMLAAGAGEG